MRLHRVVVILRPCRIFVEFFMLCIDKVSRMDECIDKFSCTISLERCCVHRWFLGILTIQPTTLSEVLKTRVLLSGAEKHRNVRLVVERISYETDALNLGAVTGITGCEQTQVCPGTAGGQKMRHMINTIIKIPIISLMRATPNIHSHSHATHKCVGIQSRGEETYWTCRRRRECAHCTKTCDQCSVTNHTKSCSFCKNQNSWANNNFSSFSLPNLGSLGLAFAKAAWIIRSPCSVVVYSQKQTHSHLLLVES